MRLSLRFALGAALLLAALASGPAVGEPSTPGEQIIQPLSTSREAGTRLTAAGQIGATYPTTSRR